MEELQQSNTLARRDFVLRAGAAALGATTVAMTGVRPSRAAVTTSMMTGKQALQTLIDGNMRFASGQPQCAPLTARRAELVNEQHPFATVLGCSDSRVPVETIFDQEPGNIFAVRVAGNVADPLGIGSMEYSLVNFKTPLLFVLGHTNCGAVNAAITYTKDGKIAPGHIQDVVVAVEPAAKASRNHEGDWSANAVMENVKGTLTSIKTRSMIVADAISSGSLTLQGGVYDLSTGKVTLV